MDLFAELRVRAAHSADAGAWQPRFFDPGQAADRADLAALLESGAVNAVRDTLAEQRRELHASRAPARPAAPAVPPADDAGRWVFYPWSRQLVRLLPPDDYRELRADRNRYKITPDEQARLRRATIAIAGLSVGLAAAVTLALESIGGAFRLADFDTLGLSNLNRLRAVTPDLGVNKAVLAARQLFEIDPYLHIEVFADGVRDDNLDAFLGGEPPTTLLVEECDDLAMKVRLREEAARRRLPVLMDTSDRGLLDVERFDHEPERPPFHGLAGPIRAADLRGLTTREKIPFVAKILDVARLSPAAAASLVEVQETLSAWPQLASGVALGGAVVADVARRVLLDQFHESGRYYVDVADLVRDGAALPLPTLPADEPPAVPAPSPAVPPRGTGPVTEAEVRYLVAHAVLAPSGGNVQPWLFVWNGQRLACRVDPARSASFLDWRHAGGYVALGAAVENLLLAAAALGVTATVAALPEPADPLLAAVVTLQRGLRPASPPPLFAAVPVRLTNRRLGERRPLADADRRALADAAGPGVRLVLLEDAAALDAAGQLLGAGDRFQFLNPARHADMLAELRWTRREANQTRDGLDLDTLELSAADRAAMAVLASRPAMDSLRAAGVGRGLGRLARTSVASSAALGLVSAPCDHSAAYFHGGRAAQRVWLTASARSLAFQPWTALPYLFARRADGGNGFTADECAELATLRSEFERLFAPPPGHTPVMLFRLAFAAAPTARSQRRPLDDVLTLLDQVGG